MKGPLALTLGEPAGIGPDITLLSWTRRAELELPAFYVLGDATYLRERAEMTGGQMRLQPGAAGVGTQARIEWQLGPGEARKPDAA